MRNETLHVALSSEDRALILDGLSLLPLNKSYNLFNRMMNLEVASVTKTPAPSAPSAPSPPRGGDSADIAGAIDDVVLSGSCPEKDLTP